VNVVLTVKWCLSQAEIHVLDVKWSPELLGADVVFKESLELRAEDTFTTILDSCTLYADVDKARKKLIGVSSHSEWVGDFVSSRAYVAVPYARTTQCAHQLQYSANT